MYFVLYLHTLTGSSDQCCSKLHTLIWRWTEIPDKECSCPQQESTCYHSDSALPQVIQSKQCDPLPAVVMSQLGHGLAAGVWWEVPPRPRSCFVQEQQFSLLTVTWLDEMLSWAELHWPPTKNAFNTSALRVQLEHLCCILIIESLNATVNGGTWSVPYYNNKNTVLLLFCINRLMQMSLTRFSLLLPVILNTTKFPQSFYITLPTSSAAHR